MCSGVTVIGMRMMMVLAVVAGCSGNEHVGDVDAAPPPFCPDRIDNECSTWTHYDGIAVFCDDGRGVCAPATTGAICEPKCGNDVACTGVTEQTYSIATCNSHVCYCATPGTTTP